MAMVMVGKCYVVMREGHDWHSDTVAVIAKKQGRFKIARASDVCENLLAPVGKRRKVKMWSAKDEELW